ncbi:MAG TPA: hypothetical protein VKX33_00090 [Cyclobacteriaceae bacterium]|nr:hypothetical protein [Cyclobacteriaceae bacterium]
MTDDEFDLMDELYFVQSYDYLKHELDWEDEKLLVILQKLFDKEWINCFSDPDEEIFDDPDIQSKGMTYFYLASKKGLLEHNAS